MNTVQQKKRHNLHVCRNTEELKRQLDNLGIDIRQLASSFVAPGRPFGLLIAGSIPEGTGTAESDLDFLLLADKSVEIRRSKAALNLETGPTKEVLLYLSGVEINIEFISRDVLQPVIEAFIKLAPAMYNPHELKEIPMMERSSLQFLHRLRTGWPLMGDPLISRWRDEFLVVLLPLYLAVTYYYEALEMIERAFSMIGGAPGCAAYIGRMAVEAGLLALLASLGFTSQSRKWIFNWCSSAEPSNGPMREILKAGQALMFPSELPGIAAQRDYLESVGKFIVSVRESLDTDPAVAKAISFLRMKISYLGVGEG